MSKSLLAFRILLVLAIVSAFSAVALAEHGSIGGITPHEHGPILWGKG